MSIFLAFAAAGATFIGGLETQLSATEADDLRITISAVNAEKEFEHPYPLFYFEMDLSQFYACNLRAVWINISNDRREHVFGATIEEDFGKYRFQILEEMMHNATLGITCDAGPNAMDPSYTIKLREYTIAP